MNIAPDMLLVDTSTVLTEISRGFPWSTYSHTTVGCRPHLFLPIIHGTSISSPLREMCK
jgi:hypothetical protein